MEAVPRRGRGAGGSDRGCGACLRSLRVPSSSPAVRRLSRPSVATRRTGLAPSLPVELDATSSALSVPFFSSMSADACFRLPDVLLVFANPLLRSCVSATRHDAWARDFAPLISRLLSHITRRSSVLPSRPAPAIAAASTSAPAADSSHCARPRLPSAYSCTPPPARAPPCAVVAQQVVQPTSSFLSGGCVRS